MLATNTMHQVYDQIAAAVSIAFPHIADPTAAAVKAAGLTRVGLLDTRFTMERLLPGPAGDRPQLVCAGS